MMDNLKLILNIEKFNIFYAYMMNVGIFFLI